MKEVAEKKTENKVRAIMPACSISEEDGVVQLRVEMPGVDKDGVEVSVEKNELIIEGKPKETSVEGKYLIRERAGGIYSKRFVLDDTIDQSKIQAVMNDGVLTLTLATKETAKPKKIEIA
jgi:HSP20 family protein